MKVSKIVAFVFLLISFSVFAGTEIQNGGVGLKINGQTATFYSAKINILPTPLVAIEGMSILIDTISRSYIGAESKFALLNSIVPNAKRKYFQLENNTPNTETVRSILLEYQQNTGVNSNDLTLFALTNPTTKTTLLLPDFFSLSPVEKATILFHESMWIQGSIQTVEQMISLEYLFQQLLEKKNPSSIFEFYEMLSPLLGDDNYSWQLTATLASEIDNYLRMTNSSQEIFFRQLIPEDALELFANIILTNNIQAKMSLVQEIIMKLQSNMQNTDDPFYYSKASMVNMLLANAKNDFNFSRIMDQKILKLIYPLDTYEPYPNPKLVDLTKSKLSNAKVMIIKKSQGNFITLYNIDNTELLSFILSP